MIWLLIIHGLMGPAVVGHFDDEESCKKAGLQLVALLEEEKRTVPTKMGCAGFPGGQIPTQETEFRDARNVGSKR